jgi:hypothetical protein
VSPRSTCSTNAGQAALTSRTPGSISRIARSYAALFTVATVPIMPTTRSRVAWTAARTPGSTTPTTGTPCAPATSAIAATWIELQATTSIFTSRRTSAAASSRPNARISAIERGP